MNQLIRFRQSALGLIDGIRDDEVLNAGAPAPAGSDPGLPDDLARALRDLKTAAISDDGARVDYGVLRASPTYRTYRGELTPRLRSFDPARLATRGERLAFWINLYNSLTIDGVVAYDVRRSVNERFGLGGFFRRAAYTVGGIRVSLEDIEHGLLRANVGNPFLPGQQFAPGDPRLAWQVAPLDPRIHFALNCASRSCPPIAAYDAVRIEDQLDLASRAFVAGDVEIDTASRTLCLSSIFSWYRDDFGGYNGVVRFVRDSLPTDDPRRRWLATQSEIDIEIKPYDWGLNA